MVDLGVLPLKAATPPAWIQAVKQDFNGFLLDHASCERKAASSALSLLARYSKYPVIVETMTTLAREELDHFAQVFRLLTERGLTLGPDEKDLYVNQLLTAVRTDTPEVRLLDRLIVSALIEARSAERFRIILEEGELDGELQAFYSALYKSEAGHYRVFIRVAQRLFPSDDVSEALARLSLVESRVMLQRPFNKAIVH